MHNPCGSISGVWSVCATRWPFTGLLVWVVQEEGRNCAALIILARHNCVPAVELVNGQPQRGQPSVTSPIIRPHREDQRPQHIRSAHPPYSTAASITSQSTPKLVNCCLSQFKEDTGEPWMSTQANEPYNIYLLQTDVEPGFQPWYFHCPTSK